jgi:hypothetical protein
VFPFGIAFMGAAYQFLRTGQLPDDTRDLYAPKTGAKVPGLGGKGQVDERVLLPGYHKDVLGWIHDPAMEAYNKLGSAWTTAHQQFTGKDWAGRPIVRPDASVMEGLEDRAKEIYSKMGPISVKSMIKGQKNTSAITWPETALGFRAAGTQYTDPESLKNFLGQKDKKEWAAKMRSENREAEQRGKALPHPEVAKSAPKSKRLKKQPVNQ